MGRRPKGFSPLQRSPVAHPSPQARISSFHLAEGEIPSVISGLGEGLEHSVMEQTECKVGPSFSRLLAVRPWMILSSYFFLVKWG